MNEEKRHFGGFCLLIKSREGRQNSLQLLWKGDECHTERRTLELLEYLTSHPQQELTKERICDVLWNDSRDLGGNLNAHMARLRDVGIGEMFVERQTRSVYKFLSDVTVEPPPDVQGPLAILKRNRCHCYHLTLDRERRAVWIYTVIDFRKSNVGLRLETSASILLNADESPETNLYQFEAEQFGMHLLIKSYRKNDNSDVCVDLYPNLSEKTLVFTGVRINDTWCPSTIARSISIISLRQLDGFQDLKPGPVRESDFDRLFEVWREKNRIVGLPMDNEHVGSALNFQHIGNGDNALSYLSERIPRATKIEDTTVRWNKSGNVYNQKAMAAFTDALSVSNAKFYSVTGLVQDEEYVNAMRSAYSQRPDQIECHRLHHASPLMNFVLIYENNQSTASEVLFGYGTHREDLTEKDTPVFRSANEPLIKEFMRLFMVLKSSQFSHKIGVNDPEFLRTRELTCDVLATFPAGFPVSEFRDRIKDCPPGKRIKVCAVAWLNLESCTEDLSRALDRGCFIEFAIWNSDDPFVVSRRAKTPIEANKVTLVKEFASHPAVRVYECHGQASVTLFWVDDLIYFSAYWVNDFASNGPHFLVRAGSPTGKFLQEQYQRMIAISAKSSRSAELSATS